MKAYLFNTENGIYSGEDFVDDSELDENEGITVLPPPERRTGTVPVFDRTSSQWKLVPVVDFSSSRGCHE